MESKYHESVMTAEVIDGLHIHKDKKYIDATLGNGGHSLEILKAGGFVLGIELDPRMLEIAKVRLEEACPAPNQLVGGSFKATLGNFKDIDLIAKNENLDSVSGILFDLGVTNLHLKDLERGFSFENPNANLDMRLNPDNQGVKASDLLNILREDQLTDLFEATLDPGAAKWISGRVMHSRANKPISTIGDMLEICHGLKTGKKRLNQATLPFLALRIAVNSELTNLEEALPKAFNLLESNGRLVIISFHSKEDEIVKGFFKNMVKNGSANLITFKSVRPGEAEIAVNRRSRSARLRVLEKK